MIPKIKYYLILLLSILIGMAIIGLAQLLPTPAWLQPAYIVLVLFICANLLSARIFNLKIELREFWGAQKIYFLPVGILAGALIAASPVFAGLLAGATTLGQISFGSGFSIGSVCTTLAIVAWEELWFRGIFLNYCSRRLSAINISLAIGLLFMLLHLLNPDINLLKTGPALFFAGALLTLIYFYFRTIWISIGLHFGNNFLAIDSNLNSHWLLGNDGHFGAMVLMVLFILFAKLTMDRTNAQSKV